MAKKEKVVVLRFVPEVDASPATQSAAPSRPIALLPFTDSRKISDPNLVGENRQGTPIPVRSIYSVTEFATKALQTCLPGWGVKLTPDAELVLRGELVTLFVVEANKYKGEARIHFRLENRDGNLLWEGIAAGEDYTWGRDLNVDNYNLVISNSLKKAYAGLLSNPGFQAAWAGKGAPSEGRVSPQEIKGVILQMLGQGIGADVIAGYVRGKQVVPSLTPELIGEWKNDGIPEDVIRAALPQ